MRPLREPFILSVSGRDRKGILAALASALADAGIEIVDIEQATLQDFLALSFLVDLDRDPDRASRLLRVVIPKASELGLAVDVRSLDGDQVRTLKETDHLVLTLISERPSSRLVADLGAAAARHGANIVSIRRLAEEDLRAGEYVLDISAVGDLDAMKADILLTAEGLGADAGLAREDVYRKSKRIVVFDMDSTLVAGELIDVLAERKGVADAVSAITRKAMEGDMDFEESLRRRVAMLAGLPESVLQEIARTLPLTPGAEEVIGVLKRLGYKLGILSGGFTVFTDALRERLGIDYAHANTVEIRDGALTGKLLGPVLDGPGKARVLREIAAREGVRPDQVVGVGDGANDIPMLQAAGLGIAFRAKEGTRRRADAAIQRNDFMGLLYLLGVSGRDVRRMRQETGDPEQSPAQYPAQKRTPAR
jgi:phosphoserine phosphatase